MFEFIGRSREWARHSIKRRLLFSSLIFWVVSVSVIGVTFLVVGQTQVKHDARIRNVQMASVIGRDVNSQLSAIFADTRVLARHLELLGPDGEAQAGAVLAFRLSSPQRYRAAYCYDEQGELILYLTESLEGLFQIKDTDALVSRPPIAVSATITMASVMATQHGLYISEVYFSELNRTPVLCLGLPVVFSTQQSHVLVLEIDLQDMWQRIDQITIGQTGFTYVVTGQGGIISHPQAAFLGQQANSNIGSLLTGYEGYSEYRDEDQAKVVLAAYSPVGGSTGWGIVVQQDVAEVNATIFRAGVIIISIWILLAIAGTIGILLLVTNFTRPIAMLTGTTRTISQTGKLQVTGLEQRTDEIGQLSYAFDQMIMRLQTSESRLAHVAAEERNRLARDLHDAVSQTLFSASIMAEVLPKLWDKNPAEGHRRLEEIRQLTRGALAEMRTLLFELRPSALADAELGYLLRQLVESFIGRQRIPVDVQVKETCQIPAQVKVALYRIAQEALNNVAKHSNAASVKVNLRCLPEEVTLSIADDGRGFEASQVHAENLGLGIMRDRARDVGASLTIQSQPGMGVEVTARWAQKIQEECYE